jgi:hypothetical protein
MATPANTQRNFELRNKYADVRTMLAQVHVPLLQGFEGFARLFQPARTPGNQS